MCAVCVGLYVLNELTPVKHLEQYLTILNTQFMLVILMMMRIMNLYLLHSVHALRLFQQALRKRICPVTYLLFSLLIQGIFPTLPCNKNTTTATE